jgi:murein DD-endopeptidase MepM/ murein hydrolase activator NlpD
MVQFAVSVQTGIWLRVALGLLFAVDAVGEELRLEGELTQGGLIQGFTVPDAVVLFDGRRVRVGEDGRFLIGFGRDAKAHAELEVRLPDARVEQRSLAIKRREYNVQRIDGLPSRMITPSKAQLARIRAEQALISKARMRDTPESYFATGFIWPVAGRITGVYGSQRILNGEPRQPHFGIDIAAPAGTPVEAPAPGIVALVHPDMYFTGGTIVLDHGRGLTSAFLHLRQIAVEEGQYVAQREVIGEVGSTGRSTGPHLDWRINLFNTRIDAQLLAGPMPPLGD